MNCEKCGSPIPVGSNRCEDCGSVVTAAPETPVTEVPATETPVTAETAEQPGAAVVFEKKDNLLTGIVGALIGAALGAGAIILLSQLGYVASLSGLVLAICTLKGYELLGGKLSTRGIIVSVLLMLVTPYIADRIDWAIALMQQFSAEGVTFAEAYAAIPILLVMNHFIGLYGVVAAQLISDGCTFILSTLIYRKVYNSLQAQISAAPAASGGTQ